MTTFHRKESAMHPAASQGQEPLVVWGDGHTHSDWSDGYDPLPTNTEVFRAYDQDFHAACDHILIDVSRPGYPDAWAMPEQRRQIFRLHHDDIATYQAEVRASSTSDHVVIDGLELTWMNAEEGNFGATNRHHILVRDHIDCLPDLDWFRGKSLHEILLDLKGRGMRPFLAHIDDAIPPDTLDGSEIDGVEIRCDIERRDNPLDLPGVRIWDSWLSQGHRIALCGGSDSHQMDLWAGSGMRTVLRTNESEREAIRGSLLSGTGYISTTWHPDLYQDLGFEGINPATSGGFTPWWKMLPGASMGSTSREQVRPQMERMMQVSTDPSRARTARTSYPTTTFTVDGHAPGDTIGIAERVSIHLAVFMNVPIRFVRLIAQGEVIWQETPGNGDTEIERAFHLSLEGCRYVRLEAHGSTGDDRHEYVITNPVYLQA